MKTVYTSLIFVLLFIGCVSTQVQFKSYPAKPKVGIVAVDSFGNEFRLVSLEKKLSDGIIQAELWEKIKPLETNHWYIPTLSSIVNTNSPITFNSILR